MDLRFFLGRGEAQRDDEVILDVDDGYNALPAKTQGICKWALEAGYDFACFLDDDVYARPERLLNSGFASGDYIGRLRGASGQPDLTPAPYASGFCYWLSKKSMKIIAETHPNGEVAEDRFVGNTLHKHGISCFADYRYVVMSSTRNARSGNEGPRQANEIIAACEFENPKAMQSIHEQWETADSQWSVGRLPSGSLSKVNILIKTFLRDQHMIQCVRGIDRNMPDAKMVIVDDGYETREKIIFYSALRAKGHAIRPLPFDSGFGAKANASLAWLDRPYVLIASDDFDFSDPTVRPGVEKLVQVLEGDPTVHVVSGRVNGQPYESCLEVGEDYAKEVPGYRSKRYINGVTYHICDLTVNYSLIRTSILGMDKIHWDGGDVKIGGGEHGAFFWDLKKADYGVAYVPGVNINELNTCQPPMNYHQYRGRARAPGRACFRARGIKKWGLQDGSWETA